MHRLVLAAVFSVAMALPADNALLNLIMPDAGLVAGFNVDRIRKTGFGQFVLSQLSVDDESFQAFKTATGFDPQRDLEEVVVATPGVNVQTRDGLLLVRGRFDLDRIRPFLSSMASIKRQSVNGTDLYLTTGTGPKAFAFLSPTLAVAGEEPHVRATLSSTTTGADPAMSAKAVELSGTQDAWFVTRNPALLTGALDDKRVQGAIKGDLFKAIDQSSGGVVFGELARFTGQAIAKTDQDAQSMADVARFMFNLIQSQGPKGGIGDLVSSVEGFDATATGNQVNVAFSVPEAKLESLLAKSRKSASNNIN